MDACNSEMKCPKELQRLIFLGKVLKGESESLASLNITEGKTVLCHGGVLPQMMVVVLVTWDDRVAIQRLLLKHLVDLSAWKRLCDLLELPLSRRR